ncbi:MAG: VWA domain-containing protein [Pseudomonadota bacterium]
MNDLFFATPGYVHLVWLVLATLALFAWLELGRGDRLGRFLSSAMAARLAFRQGALRRAVRLVAIAATGLFGVAALMQPQTLGGVETRSQTVRADIMVVLDVSKSMLAEDAAPSRLARAKAEIVELIERVSDHRVGLIAFAGRASVKSPLTTDYGFFRLVLRGVDPGSISRGGTEIGTALRKAIAAFGPNRGAPRVLLLITDGEDHDSYPEDAIEDLLAAGIRIVAIGFGSEAGSTITLRDPETGARSTLTDGEGNVVRSRLDGELLRTLALRTEGVYVPAGTSAVDLDAIVETHIEPLVSQTGAEVERRQPTQHYPWPLFGALLAFLLAIWLGAGGAQRAEDDA